MALRFLNRDAGDLDVMFVLMMLRLAFSRTMTSKAIVATGQPLTIGVVAVWLAYMLRLLWLMANPFVGHGLDVRETVLTQKSATFA